MCECREMLEKLPQNAFKYKQSIFRSIDQFLCYNEKEFRHFLSERKKRKPEKNEKSEIISMYIDPVMKLHTCAF